MDIKKIREDFPILGIKYQDKNLVYFDNAATSQKPRKVIEAISSFYENENANIHRGIHFLAERSTEKYELVREKIKKFLKAEKKYEVIFSKNATESLNLIAQSWGDFLNEGEAILTTRVEHHSNFLPWQILANKKFINLDFIEIDEDGKFIIDKLEEIIKEKKVKLIAITQISNVLGVKNDIKKIIEIAHKNNAKVVVDGCQSVPHLLIDLDDLNADFFVFTGHKLYGPTGVGVLLGKKDLLETMPPFLSGGGMVKYVKENDFEPAEIPEKFEAGTPPIAEVIGLGAAIDYVNNLGVEKIEERENSLNEFMLEKILELDFVKILGSKNAKERIGVVSFAIEGVHPHDVAEIMNEEAICVRAGQHCAHNLMSFLKISATTRASLSFYNTEEEVMRFVETLKKIRNIF